MKDTEKNNLEMSFPRSSNCKASHSREDFKLAWAEANVTDEGVKFTLGREYAYRSYAIELEQIIGRIVSLPESMEFTIDRGKFGRSVNLVTLNRAHNALGRLLLSCLENSHADLLDCYPGHRFSPLVEITLRVAAKHQVTGSNFLRWDTFSNQFAEMLTRLVAEIRSEAERVDWKNLKRNFHRNANKNYNNILKQLKALLLRHAKILVIRLDFMYRKILVEGCDREKISYDIVRADRERFLVGLRRAYGAALLGYATKLESGLERGYHYHVLILLDGSKHREGISNGQRIGEIWGLVTGGGGIFNNCNMNYKNYRYVGVGMAKYCESAIWEGFKHIAKYLVKPDHHVRLSLPKNHRSFHMSFPPKGSELRSRPGRPRKKRMSVL